MARKILVNLDFQGNEVYNFVLETVDKSWNTDYPGMMAYGTFDEGTLVYMDETNKQRLVATRDWIESNYEKITAAEHTLWNDIASDGKHSSEQYAKMLYAVEVDSPDVIQGTLVERSENYVSTALAFDPTAKEIYLRLTTSNGMLQQQTFYQNWGEKVCPYGLGRDKVVKRGLVLCVDKGMWRYYGGTAWAKIFDANVPESYETRLANIENYFSSEEDADKKINRWNEIVKFLDEFEENDSLLATINGKADKATTLAGYGITDAVKRPTSSGASEDVLIRGSNENATVWRTKKKTAQGNSLGSSWSSDGKEWFIDISEMYIPGGTNSYVVKVYEISSDGSNPAYDVTAYEEIMTDVRIEVRTPGSGDVQVYAIIGFAEGVVGKTAAETNILRGKLRAVIIS